MDSSTELVIKVNYGSVLRRFRVHFSANRQLDLDMARLRKKIVSLFNLPVDAQFSLTYTDEDGDVVTLVDDSDLHDVVNQNLKFLKINVQLNPGLSASSCASMSGEGSARYSEDPLTKIHEGLNDMLMVVPNPLRDTISKVSMDLASKAVGTSAVVDELLHCISKLGQVARPQESSSSSPIAQNVSGDGGGLPSMSATCGPSSGKEVPTKAAAVDLNSEPPRDVKAPSSSEQNYVTKETQNKRKPFNPSAPDVPPKTTNHAFVPSVPGASFNECPFSCAPVKSDNSPNLFNKHRRRTCHSKKSNDSDFWTSLGMFHKGIRCDGCGVLPITGPRFKSKVKEDYDLCSICFSQMGNERDYIRMDRPVSVQPLHKAREPFAPALNTLFTRTVPVPPNNPGELNLRLGRPKLDSRFVLDVNVFDGTAMAPSTPFTKLWRMRNNGSLVWPRGTQLVWIGGDMFSNSLSVDLEIPEQGVGVDSELNVAVDFVAPESPGRYTSYWRMASSSGAKFGQRVWVLIHVDASLKDSVVNVFHGLNLNASPEEGSSKEFEPRNEPDQYDSPVLETVTPVADLKPKVEESKAVEKEDLLIGEARPVSPRNLDPSSASRHIIDLTEPAAPAEGSLGGSSTKHGESNDAERALLEELDGKNDVEQGLLKELEEMGFKETDLNKEVLRQNKYNLEQSVDALCGVSEWDPILEELREMGFRDSETNKRLLEKNNGSIMRAVMDLLTGDKA